MAQEKMVGYGAGTDASGNPQAGNNQGQIPGSEAIHTVKPEAYYDMLLLKMLRQMEFHYSKYAIQKSLPRNYGETINWRRFKKLEVRADRGLLTEGVTPEGKDGIQGESITAAIKQYGEVMYFTDLIDLQQLDDVRREYTIELGYIAQETLDLIVRDELVAGGSVAFAGGGAELAASGAPSIDDFRRIVLGFKKDFVKGVRGAGSRYVALISPEVMFALFDDERMIQYMSFGNNNAPLQDGVAVDMFGIRFEEVLNAPVVGEFHDSIVLADEAYAITKLQGEGNVRVITKGLGSAGIADPLDQRQSIGYKITGFAAKVLRSESVVNYWSRPLGVSGTNDLTAFSKGTPSRITTYAKSAAGDIVKVTFAVTSSAPASIGADAVSIALSGQSIAHAVLGTTVAVTNSAHTLAFFTQQNAANGTQVAGTALLSSLTLTDAAAGEAHTKEVTIYVSSAA
jgi:N4-gp56 family major capsid protein